ncbi:hypothetical protein BJV77DRAFT_727827 [Russula vinacea]|nr:hypothetical protein BJV77DRAFT_727827 [Russula vinacea]
MTLSSSTSRQQRKSMLPKPRPSSRITGSGPRRIASSETSTVTSRIARRVPSPLLLTTASCNNDPDLITQPRGGTAPHTHPVVVATDYNLLQLPTKQSEPSSTPSPEAKKKWVDVNVQYRTLPPTTPSAEAKHERFFTGQEGQGQGRTIAIPTQQQQDTAENYDPAAASLLARHAHAPPPRRRRPASASTALSLSLTNNGFSRVLDNSPPTHGGGDGIMPALAWKKSAVTRSVVVGGKENRRPTRMHTRVPPPPVPPVLAPNIPPRSVRRTVVVAQPPSRPTTTTTSSSFRETSRPLVIRKQLPSHSLAAAGSSHVRSASGASGTLPVVGPVPAGIQALIGDIDRFAKDWTEMFDELSEGPEDGRLSKLDAFIRIRPTGWSEDAGHLQADNTVTGKGLASTNGETVQFDVTLASLARWQQRDKSMVKDAPEKEKPERDLPEATSASTTDPPRDGAHHLRRVALRNASLSLTPQASRHLPSFPEVN